MKKKIITVSIVVCIIFMSMCYYVWKEWQANPKGNKELDFTKIDRISLCFADDELFTENKKIIKKLFPKDSVYTKTKDDVPEFAGIMYFNVYDGKKLLYKINPLGDELEKQYIYINDDLYIVENPTDYERIFDLIQDENMKKD
ncbi:MAG: hypothetical protein K2M60_08535 [Lachnospiraceae bacterium]|nr:hypothetical protein [Lachnospiraceae bacterium]MDE6251519.1 hypothetical protein [Lachnospiraceae bacterium]